jgi:hypothetical protein
MPGRTWATVRAVNVSNPLVEKHSRTGSNRRVNDPGRLASHRS